MHGNAKSSIRFTFRFQYAEVNLLVMHSYSMESFRRTWGFSMSISVLGLAITSHYEFNLKTWEETL